MSAPKPRRVPISSYRLQFSANFTYRNATALVPYLSRLGITECYCSPLLAAGPSGYEVSDHNRLNSAFGTDSDFADFVAALTTNNMGLILDFVPNHMGIDPSSNLWWRDVLENGASSIYADFFDIDWNTEVSELKGKTLLPILGDQYGVELESRKIQLSFSDGEFSLHYYQTDLPINLKSARMLLRHNIQTLEEGLAPTDVQFREFLSILSQLDHMPPHTETDPIRIEELRREKAIASKRLADLVRESEAISAHIDRNIREFNGDTANTASFDLLHNLLEQQPYRIAYWRTALHEINYRRFFDINDLAGIHMEYPQVFEAAHALVLRLIQSGAITGLRLDHVDGLFDPKQYLEDLYAHCEEAGTSYIVVEKILSNAESLRLEWPVHGSTGYDFLNELNGLFVRSRSGQKFKQLYLRVTGNWRLFFDVVYESKKLIITASMASELRMLARELNRITKADRRHRDFTLTSLQDSLREIVACFPVYRTYFSLRGSDEFDRRAVETAFARAQRRNPATDPSVYQFIRTMLLPERSDSESEGDYLARAKFAMHFQQYTSPIQAKGLEDTAFYRYSPLASLNEVGGDPARFGYSPVEFHEANQERLEHWPLTMLSTSTHDTKWGEDARARLNVLSELPDEWRLNLFRWFRTNAGMRTLIDGKPAPSRSDEYLYYQALIAAWPPEAAEGPPPEFVERIVAFLQKAIKEEKVHTSWINPSEPYDHAMAEFIRRTLAGAGSARFLSLFLPFQRRIAFFGMVNSLAQLVLKIVSPGVTDFYQGSELWNLNLTDPDNRRPVNFSLRETLLDGMEEYLQLNSAEKLSSFIPEAIGSWPDGRIKLYITAACLRLRRSQPELFYEGEYLPLSVEGKRAAHVIAVARVHKGRSIIAVVPRMLAGLLTEVKGLPQFALQEETITLPPTLASLHYRDLFTRNSVPLDFSGDAPRLSVTNALSLCPVAILTGVGKS